MILSHGTSLSAGGTTSHLVLHPQLVHHEERRPELQFKEPHEWYHCMLAGGTLALDAPLH